ncbi:MAG: hypothetical protein US63_C0002G0004 [Candidatus Moranbacteria bacterium GW2011_GWC2_37_8]|nr:MAG: hypothetical protein US63_C0002G0004 [Candidatus Moranbacteria bacterium GW2011_GWC2_37_8]KKQ62714.1 MAG: hypothetical protein US82_C0007G0004 [Parcubacteria group bacterium GW2011_GWC1_38_22]
MLKDTITVTIFLALSLSCVFTAPRFTSYKSYKHEEGYPRAFRSIMISIGILLFALAYIFLSQACTIIFKNILLKCSYRVDPSLNIAFSYLCMIAILPQMIDLHRAAIRNRILKEFCRVKQ